MNQLLLLSTSLFLVACGFGDNAALVGPGAGPDAGFEPRPDGAPSPDAPEPPDPACGNGILEAGEACDDGNATSGDGCAPGCQLETPACTLVPQSGCPAGQACDLVGTELTACRAVTTQGSSNSHCTVATGCRAGYTCVADAEPSNASWCARFCEDDADCTGTGSRCVHELQSGGAPAGASVCSNACDPYAQTGCPSQMGCVVADATGGDFTDCQYVGTTPDGGSCATTADCRIGSECVEVNGVPRCESYCVVGNPGTCSSSLTCFPFVPSIVVGTVQYGSCG